MKKTPFDEVNKALRAFIEAMPHTDSGETAVSIQPKAKSYQPSAKSQKPKARC